MSFEIKMKDETGKTWVGYKGQRIAVHDPQSISLSPSKATIKVGGVKSEKYVQTRLNVSYAYTGNYSLKNNEWFLLWESGRGIF